MAGTNPFSLQSDDAAAKIRAERAASNAAIARRDAKGTIANMLSGYRGTWAQSQMHSSREAVYAALKQQYADPAMLGYVRTPMVIEVSAIGAVASEYGRWVGRHRTADGVQELSGTYYATWHRTAGGWRIEAGLPSATVLRRRHQRESGERSGQGAQRPRVPTAVAIKATPNPLSRCGRAPSCCL